ncbi:hypothetical protein RchiOBHm_Chr6g0310581 [Rosa chinensis]|uniref:Uncharacterized protein n=1 Tax=Rosa chinensis TaxID=74649 RepID=A0A2P6Q168_ROSCH|nr:hypothetical protein RchiOBHm_Chr6g0310581 [Rosa chinensis]
MLRLALSSSLLTWNFQSDSDIVLGFWLMTILPLLLRSNCSRST